MKRLVEDTNWSDEEQEVKIYSIFHEWKDDDEDKYKDLEYNFGDYYNDNAESNNDNYEIYENDYDYNYNNDYYDVVSNCNRSIEESIPEENFNKILEELN